MPNGPDGWARPIAEIRVDSRSADDALTDLFRWLVQEPDLGAAGARVKRGAGHTSGMGLPEWLQVSADSLAVGSVLVRSLTAWRRSRRPIEPAPPVVLLRWNGREYVVGDDEAAVQRALDELEPPGDADPEDRR